MVDLNKLSKPALSAAMRGGTEGWGEMGSSTMNVRYIDLAPPRSRRRCHCGCEGRATHRGLANGVCLVSGCQMAILRWVKTGSTKVRTAPAPRPDAPTSQIKIRTYCDDCGKSVSDEPDGIHTCSPQYGKSGSAASGQGGGT